jgi:iron complex transport system substrate-binding protein
MVRFTRVLASPPLLLLLLFAPPLSHGATTYPLKVTNCGVQSTFSKPPSRAVALNQATTEILLALGLEDMVAATAYLDDSVDQQWAEAYKKVRQQAGR